MNAPAARSRVVTARRVADVAQVAAIVAGLLMWVGLLAYTPLLPDWWSVCAPIGILVASLAIPVCLCAGTLADRRQEAGR